MKPSEVEPALADERLAALAKLVVGVHNQRLRTHQPENGDDSYTFGCGRFGRLRNALFAASHSDAMPWLTVRPEQGLAIRIFISGCEVVLFRGDPDEPNSRCRNHGLRGVDPEEQGLLVGIEREDGWFWAMGMENDDKLRVKRIVFEQVHWSGQIRHRWQVPVDTTYCLPAREVATVKQAKVRPLAPKAQTAPAPTFGPKGGARPSDVHDGAK